MTPSAMPATEAPLKASKGPPPLPTTAAAPPSHGTPVEAMFFVEGVDGRAESLPWAEPYAPASDEHPSPDADSTPASHDDEWVEAGDGLPNVEVSGLTIVPGARKLFAATHGRSAWSLTLP